MIQEALTLLQSPGRVSVTHPSLRRRPEFRTRLYSGDPGHRPTPAWRIRYCRNS